MYRLFPSFIYCARWYSVTRQARCFCSHIPKVEVLSTKEDENMRISFKYSNSPRPYNVTLKAVKEQTVDEVLSHIKELITLYQKKERLTKQVVLRSGSSSEVVNGNEEEDFEVALVRNDRQLDTETKNIDAWTQGVSLRIGNELYEIHRNTPKVTELTLPEYIVCGCFFRPHIMLDRATIEDSDFTWYRSTHNQESHSENSCEEVDIVEGDIRWQKVSKGFVYEASPSDVGRKLKVVCTPKRGMTSGAAYSTVSNNAVLAAPEMFPFEERHLYTKELVDSDCIRCVTYNVLANCYVETRKFPYCTRKARDPQYRKQLLIKELLGYNGDIICLQEVQERVFLYDLLPVLQKFSFHGYFELKGKRRHEGVATFYRTTKFRVVEQKGVHLNGLLKEKEIVNDLLKKVSGNLKDMSKLLVQDTVLQVTLLEHLHQPGHRVLVANTHLYSNKDTPEVRLIQSAICTYYTEHLLKAEKDPEQTALIFCGDFNSLPDSPAHKFMMNGIFECCPTWKKSMSSDDTDTTLRHSLSLESACGTPVYTNYTEEFSGCLDYIFYSKSNLSVSEVVPMPRHEEVTRQVALPSELFPSDHLALVCTLKWKRWNDIHCVP